MELPVQFGRYLVAERIGSGQMGTVYRALDPLIDRPVAVKVLRDRPEMGSDDRAEWQARFEREVRVSGKLSHPNLVAVLDVGLEGDDAFIVMEYVDGTDLEAVLEREHTLPVESVLEICADIAGALDHAHAHGVVHRDIKPANILLSRDGVAKVADFGVAHIADNRLTRTGITCGTPAFMSPEQATANALGPASDQFSLAAVAYLMLVGEIPFSGSSASAVLYRLVNEEPVPAASINPAIPTALSDALLRGLAKNPAERYATCAAMVEALRAAIVEALRAASSPAAGSRAGGGHRDTTVMTPAVSPHPPRSPRPKRRQAGDLAATFRALAAAPGGRVALLAAPVLLAGLLGVWALNLAAGGAPGGAELDATGAPLAATVGDDGTSDSAGGEPGTEDTDGGGALSEGLSERARNAGLVLDEALAGAERIPRRLLANARCVAVIPGVIRFGLGFGGHYGKGLVSCRVRGGWSAPAFVSLTGASFRLQVGAQSSDLVLVFTASEALAQLGDHELELGGGGATMSAGPLGDAADRDAFQRGDVYSYSRSKGLFAGVSLNGATLTADERANYLAYGRGVTPAEILSRPREELSPELATFVRALRAGGS